MARRHFSPAGRPSSGRRPLAHVPATRSGPNRLAIGQPDRAAHRRRAHGSLLAAGGPSGASSVSGRATMNWRRRLAVAPAPSGSGSCIGHSLWAANCVCVCGGPRAGQFVLASATSSRPLINGDFGPPLKFHEPPLTSSTRFRRARAASNWPDRPIPCSGSRAGARYDSPAKGVIQVTHALGAARVSSSSSSIDRAS